MNQRVKESYDQLVDRYEHEVDTKNAYNVYYERPAMMQQLPQDMEGMHVLDAGCAAGWYTQQFVERRAHVTAVDISPNMVAAAKRRVGQSATVLCCDLAEALPFANDSFDYVVSSLVMHYIADWKPVFREFRRILKSNGRFLFSIHHPFMDIALAADDNYFAKSLIIDHWKHNNEVVEVPFYRRSMSEILKETLNYFTMECVVEPQPTKAFEQVDANKYERLLKRPHFLIIKASKGEVETNGQDL